MVTHHRDNSDNTSVGFFRMDHCFILFNGHLMNICVTQLVPSLGFGVTYLTSPRAMVNFISRQLCPQSGYTPTIDGCFRGWLQPLTRHPIVEAHNSLLVIHQYLCLQSLLVLWRCWLYPIADDFPIVDAYIILISPFLLSLRLLMMPPRWLMIISLLLLGASLHHCWQVKAAGWPSEAGMTVMLHFWWSPPVDNQWSIRQLINEFYW